MSAIRSLVGIGTVLLVTACGTVEQNAWTHGVPPEVATDARRAFDAVHRNCKVYAYYPEEGGSVSLVSECGSFRARRVRGSWHFEQMIVVG